MKKHLIILALFSTLACDDKRELPTDAPAVPNHVVLIFNNAESHAKYILPTFGNQSVENVFSANGYEISVINDELIPTRHRFDINVPSDTVIINTKRDLLEVKLTYKAIDELTYYFQKGDTVAFTYEENKPIAKIINRKENPEVTNFSLYQRDSVYQDDLPAMVIFNHSMLVFSLYHKGDKQAINYDEFEKNYRLQASKTLSEELESDIIRISKFMEQDLISEEQHNAILSDLYWQLTNKLSQLKYLPEKENFNHLRQVLTDLERDHPVLALRNDSLLVSGVYQNFIESKAKRLYPLPMLESKGRGSASRVRDYATSYDSIQGSTEFSPTERKLLQYKNVDKILSKTTHFNIDTRLKYLTKFKVDYQDTTLFNNFVKKYRVKFEIDDKCSIG